MVDVHDIDALLISALYGELTPADEARLAAHLESHPTDRAALDDLTHARSLVHDSRILTFQLDPPQSVSALLLQEAARRAPAVRRQPADEGRESWFFRFARSFAAHPAMAAAAMLVLVVGAAGVMKMRDHGDFADKAIETRRAELGTPAAAPSVATAGDLDQQAEIAAPQGAVAAIAPADAMQAQLQTLELSGTAQSQRQLDLRAESAGSSAGYTVGLADAENDEKKVTKSASNTVATGDNFYKAPPMKAAPHAAKKGIDVTTPTLALKEDRDGEGDVDDSTRARKLEQAKDTKPESFGRTAPGAGGGAAPPAAPVTTTTPTPAPPPAQAPAPVVKAPAPAADKSVDKPADHRAADPTLVAWAEKQLKQVVQLAHDNKCDDAARVAATISTSAPDYYAANVASNRELKQCMAYIAEARDRAEKAAAQQRAAPKPASTSK